MSYYYGFRTVCFRRPIPLRPKAMKPRRQAGQERPDGISPVKTSTGRTIARTFWGQAWCDNLESYSDFENRLPCGCMDVRNGSVIDLQITKGEVRAQVVGSSLYKVVVRVVAVPGKQWQSITTDCAGSIDSMVELLQGRLSKAVMERRICRPHNGLFPAPKEIQFSCNPADWASMCKHVAAVLYGVGARLDSQPELIFTLRRVDPKDLVAQAGASLRKARPSPPVDRVLDADLVRRIRHRDGRCRAGEEISLSRSQIAGNPQDNDASQGGGQHEGEGEHRPRRL